MANVTLGPVRFSYANVWEPKAMPDGKTMKYSVCVLIPEQDSKQIKMINDAVQEAIRVGIEEKGCFTKRDLPRLKLPLRNGTAESEAGTCGVENNGYMFFNCSSFDPPEVRDRYNQPMMEKEDFYSGCWGYIVASFFPFPTRGSDIPNKGVGVGFNAVMKKQDDDRLDGRISADKAFADHADEVADAVQEDGVNNAGEFE